MLIILDTHAVSDLLRRHAKARARLSSLSPADQVRTCAIVRGEILFGIERLAPGKNKDDLRIQVESLFQTATCEPIHISTAQRYSQIKCAMEKGGLALGENDLWIAACAMDLGAVLVTRDKGFQHVPALIVEDWTQ